MEEIIIEGAEEVVVEAPVAEETVEEVA